MTFLEDLRAYLEQPVPSRRVFVPDVAAHRKHLFDALERLEKQGRDKSFIQRQLDLWERDAFERHIQSMARLMEDGFGHAASHEQVERLIDIAVDRALGLDTSTGSVAKDHELDKLRRHEHYRGRPGSGVARYAIELRAVRCLDEGAVLTPIGKLILELPARDAVRWMLAAEVVQSNGARDEWRLSRDTAARFLEAPHGSLDTTEDEDEWFIQWPALERLSQLGLLRVEDEYPKTPFVVYELLPEGRRAFEEVASGVETPFMLLARALLQDETDAVLTQYPAAASMTRTESAASIVTRHARMVAHEIRNAMVPVQSAVESLYRNAERQGQSALVEGPREEIDGGIARVFRFLKDISRIADLATAPPELFDVAPAVQAAIAAFVADLGRPIPFEQTAPLAAVRGNRDRLVLAVINVLRNAAQTRPGVEVAIRVSVGARNGAEVFIAIDDDGPGVPPEHRTSVFEPGFSLRPEGTGQGLALVREVVETEMAGRAICEESPLGGARFVIRLPVGARRNG